MFECLGFLASIFPQQASLQLSPTFFLSAVNLSLSTLIVYHGSVKVH